MNLKPTLLAVGLAVACGGLAIAPAALAADGTITINGQINATTCTVSNAGGSNFTVTLPTVSQGALATSGAVAGQTPFAISLSGCGATSQVAIHFEPGSGYDTATGNLTSTGTATDAEVQLLNSDGSAIALPGSGATATTDASGNATTDYFAQYYATGAAGAGSVAATTQYSITYP